MERTVNTPFTEVSQLKVVFVSDRGDSEQCVICCTEIQLEVADNQSDIFSPSPSNLILFSNSSSLLSLS